MGIPASNVASGEAGGNGLAAADDARSFIGSDRAKPDTAKSAHHAIEP